MNEHQEVFKETLKICLDSVNLYLVYSGIRKSCIFHLKKEKFQKMLKFCKKHKLNYVYEKRNKFDKRYTDKYDIVISKKKLPKNLFNKKKFIKVLGNIYGFPKDCIDFYMKPPKKKKEKKTYGHKIKINFVLKNSKKIHKHAIYVFLCDRLCHQEMKKMTDKIYNDFNKNLKDIFSYYSIRYYINYTEGYDVGELID